MTIANFRTDGPIHGRTPRTDTPGLAKVVRFQAQPQPDREDNWRNHAACRDVDGDLFFPIGMGPDAAIQTRKALAYCAACPVIEKCAEFLAHMQAVLPGSVEGVWAGTTQASRDAEQRRARSARDRARAKAKKQAAA